MYCIDASVLTNSQMEHEEFHEYSKKLMGITKLISLDKQQRERASNCIDALIPQEELENLCED